MTAAIAQVSLIVLGLVLQNVMYRLKLGALNGMLVAWAFIGIAYVVARTLGA